MGSVSRICLGLAGASDLTDEVMRQDSQAYVDESLQEYPTSGASESTSCQYRNLLKERVIGWQNFFFGLN
jgi:hypothetical protein